MDLMLRQTDPAGGGSEATRYTCRFMLTGAVPDASVVLEDEGVGGTWTLRVNQILVSGWQPGRAWDCHNLQAPVGHLLRGGSTPTLNTVTVEASGPGRGLREIPYLHGSFTCAYRYAHLSFPFVRGGGLSGAAVPLQPWGLMGYPTYSGSACYRRSLRLERPGEYLLDLGRVEDCAAVSLDGRQVAVLAWPPYCCRLGKLARGEHALEVEVCNPPANRNRAAGLPAGLLGPVRIERCAG
jgi:hypothetical protein